MKCLVAVLFLPAVMFAYTKSATPPHSKWADIILKGKECSVKIRQGKHRLAEGIVKSTSGGVQKMAIIIRNKRADGDIHVESDCEILKIDFSDNAVGKPVRKVRNRVLWEWKMVRE
ncbi:hypothetical protein NNO_2061 [Hydrogenimonas sp.]|nr:hypothetical protein NNO_2061 [Hydrogenimonas sp.]